MGGLWDTADSPMESGGADGWGNCSVWGRLTSIGAWPAALHVGMVEMHIG